MADGKVGASFAEAEPLEAFFYGISTLRRYVHQAGFVETQVLPIDNDAWRFYRLVP